jgi:predicted  nucleic acid-binding Zn-ribbon protein
MTIFIPRNLVSPEAAKAHERLQTVLRRAERVETAVRALEIRVERHEREQGRLEHQLSSASGPERSAARRELEEYMEEFEVWKRKEVPTLEALRHERADLEGERRVLGDFLADFVGVQA